MRLLGRRFGLGVVFGEGLVGVDGSVLCRTIAD